MENSSPLVFDVSSDEEAGFGGLGICDGYGGGQFRDGDDCDWLSKLLGQVGGNGGDFCDDVVLVSETFSNPPKKPRLEPPDKVVAGDESDGDDCVILDGDPDKPVTEKGKVDGGGGDDDVEIIAEKGEVACRDFPHARHLCARFLFASTPPQVHCTQCHCYVCDSLAPCPHWGTGVSSVDHCHATDKEEYWKTERKRMKRGNKPLPSVSVSNNNSPLSVFKQTRAQSRRHPAFRPVTSQPVLRPVTSHPVFRPVTSQPICQGEPRPPGCAFRPVSEYRPPSRLLPVQSRGNYPKRTELVGVSKPNNRHLNGARPSVNPVRRRMLHQVVRTCSDHLVQQNNLPKGLNISHRSHLPSHPQVCSQPYSIQTPLPPPSYVNSTNSMRPVPAPAHMASHPSTSPHLFQPIRYAPPQSGVGNNAIGSKPETSITVMPSVQCSGSMLENTNQPSQPQSLSYPSSLFDNLPSNFPQVDHYQNSAIDSIPDDFGLAWDSEPQGVEKAVNLQKGMVNVDYNNHQRNDVVVADNQLSLTTDPGSEFPHSIPHDRLDFLLDNWMLGDLPFHGVSEVPVSPLWNNEYSPEPASVVDAGDLFNF